MDVQEKPSVGMYGDGWAEVNDKEQERGKKDVGVVRSCECNTAIDYERIAWHGEWKTRRKTDDAVSKLCGRVRLRILLDFDPHPSGGFFRFFPLAQTAGEFWEARPAQDLARARGGRTGSWRARAERNRRSTPGRRRWQVVVVFRAVQKIRRRRRPGHWPGFSEAAF